MTDTPSDPVTGAGRASGPVPGRREPTGGGLDEAWPWDTLAGGVEEAQVPFWRTDARPVSR